jgi:hypothetical protein
MRLDAALNLHAACDLLVTSLLLVFAIGWTAEGDRLSWRATGFAAATLACLTKETAFVVIPVLALARLWRPRLAGHGARLERPERDDLVLGFAVAVLFGVRWLLLHSAAGSYAERLWAHGPGARGLVAGVVSSLVPHHGVFELMSRAGAWLPPGAHLPVGLAGALLLAALGPLVWRALPPSRPRRLAIALALAGLLPFALSVNARTAYLPGAGAALWLAALPFPSARAMWVSATALVLCFLVGTVLRADAWLAANRIASQLRARSLELAEARGASRVFLFGSPDLVRGVRSSPGSECWALLHPEEPQVVPLSRGASFAGWGPALERAAETATLSRTEGFRFLGDYCRRPEALFPPDLSVDVSCVEGRPRRLTVPCDELSETPALFWSGGTEVEVLCE